MTTTTTTTVIEHERNKWSRGILFFHLILHDKKELICTLRVFNEIQSGHESTNWFPIHFSRKKSWSIFEKSQKFSEIKKKNVGVFLEFVILELQRNCKPFPENWKLFQSLKWIETAGGEQDFWVKCESGPAN